MEEEQLQKYSSYYFPFFQMTFGAVNAETEDGSAPRLQQFLVKVGSAADVAALEKAIVERSAKTTEEKKA